MLEIVSFDSVDSKFMPFTISSDYQVDTDYFFNYPFGNDTLSVLFRYRFLPDKNSVTIFYFFNLLISCCILS